MPHEFLNSKYLFVHFSAGMLIHVKGSLKILRIYGRAVEDNDYPPLMDSKISGKPKSNHTCAKDLQVHTTHARLLFKSSE